MAPSSAYVSAPSSESTPPSTHTESASPALPPAACSVSAGTRKMPEPITVPIVIMTMSRRPSVRARSGRVSTGLAILLRREGRRDLLREGLALLRLQLPRRPVDAQAAARGLRDDVEVHVEHGLVRRGPVVLQHVVGAGAGGL